MAMNSEQHAAALERLSALLDGELDDDAVGPTCAQWRDSSESRASWHAYHLIGDVLRSDDLACDPGSDAAFLRAFRARLATEPVVLAPQPAPAGGIAAARAKSVHRTWRAASAVAAGFVAVAGIVLVMRGPGSASEGNAGVAVAQSAPVAPALRVVSAVTVNPMPAISEPQTFIADGKLIRDARLDRYLQAHHEFAGSSALGVPSAFLRAATTPVAIDR